jgi:hypothetical protein
MILTLQRRLREAGRIRIGAQVPAAKGKTRPTKLEAFRLTSADQAAIQAAAKLYGGEPHIWVGAPVDGEVWEVFTQASVIPVVVPPAAAAMSQFFETWSGGGCTRRCDGQRELISESPCICATENETTCKPTTRLNVILQELPGLGVWRLESHGWYAATELAGTVEVCMAAATRGQLLPAVLRLEQRQIKRVGETVKKFAVPVLDIQLTPSALGLVVGQAAIGPANQQPPVEAAGESWHPIAAPPVAELEAGETSAAIKDAGTDGPKKRKNSPPELPPTGIKPRGRKAAEPEPPPPEPPPAGPSDAQIRKMMATFNELDIKSRDDRLAFIAAAARPVASSKDLTVEEAGRVLDALDQVVAGTLDMVYAKEGLQLFAKGSIQPLVPVGAGAPIYPDDEESF